MKRLFLIFISCVAMALIANQCKGAVFAIHHTTISNDPPLFKDINVSNKSVHIEALCSIINASDYCSIGRIENCDREKTIFSSSYSHAHRNPITLFGSGVNGSGEYFGSVIGIFRDTNLVANLNKYGWGTAMIYKFVNNFSAQIYQFFIPIHTYYGSSYVLYKNMGSLKVVERFFGNISRLFSGISCFDGRLSSNFHLSNSAPQITCLNNKSDQLQEKDEPLQYSHPDQILSKIQKPLIHRFFALAILLLFCGGLLGFLGGYCLYKNRIFFGSSIILLGFLMGLGGFIM